MTWRERLINLATRLSDLEGKTNQLSTLDHAHCMSPRLNDLDSEFKGHCYGLVDLIDDEEGVLKKQKILDEHDNDFLLAVRI